MTLAAGTPALMRRLGPEYSNETEWPDATLQEWLDDAADLLGDDARYGDSYAQVHAWGALALLTEAEKGRTDRQRTNQGLQMVGALVSVSAGTGKTFRTSDPFRDLPPELVATWGTSRHSLKVIGHVLQTEGDTSTPYLVEV